MKSFSQRYGYKPVKTIIQVETMDDDLRVSLWNELDSYYWSKAEPQHLLESETNKTVLWLLEHIWSEYFKQPTDTIGNKWDAPYKLLRNHFFSFSWNEVYDFVEFVANHYFYDHVNDSFKERCNEVLKREVSGYRFIGDMISPISSEEEIAEIEEALNTEKPFEPVVIHLRSALDLFSDRESPDYRNSIKESISAVEAMCILIAGSGATLGKALGAIQREGKVTLHPALRQAFDNLYGYSSDADGIRHALMDESDLGFEDAKLMLVSCSAFINYLKVKSAKAGIEIETK